MPISSSCSANYVAGHRHVTPPLFPASEWGRGGSPSSRPAARRGNAIMGNHDYWEEQERAAPRPRAPRVAHRALEAKKRGIPVYENDAVRLTKARPPVSGSPGSAINWPIFRRGVFSHSGRAIGRPTILLPRFAKVTDDAPGHPAGRTSLMWRCGLPSRVALQVVGAYPMGGQVRLPRLVARGAAEARAVRLAYGHLRLKCDGRSFPAASAAASCRSASAFPRRSWCGDARQDGTGGGVGRTFPIVLTSMSQISSLNGEIPRRPPSHAGPRLFTRTTDFSGIVYHANYLRFMERGPHQSSAPDGPPSRHALFEQAYEETPGASPSWCARCRSTFWRVRRGWTTCSTSSPGPMVVKGAFHHAGRRRCARGAGGFW